MYFLHCATIYRTVVTDLCIGHVIVKISTFCQSPEFWFEAGNLQCLSLWRSHTSWCVWCPTPLCCNYSSSSYSHDGHDGKFSQWKKKLLKPQSYFFFLNKTDKHAASVRIAMDRKASTEHMDGSEIQYTAGVVIRGFCWSFISLMVW